MRKIAAVFLGGVLIGNLLGCQHLRHPITAVKKAATELFPPYSGLRAGITVVDFDAKAAKATNEINAGLRAMLVSGLAESGRFLIIERQLPGNEDDTQKNKNAAADLIVAVTVLQFEPQCSGGTAGVGGGGSANSGLLGGLLESSVNKAHITLDVRLVNASTSEVIASAKIRGQAKDGNTDAKRLPGRGRLSAGLQDYSNTAMEKAIYMSIDEAAYYIAETVPEEYFKYK